MNVKGLFKRRQSAKITPYYGHFAGIFPVCTYAHILSKDQFCLLFSACRKSEINPWMLFLFSLIDQTLSKSSEASLARLYQQTILPKLFWRNIPKLNESYLHFLIDQTLSKSSDGTTDTAWRTRSVHSQKSSTKVNLVKAPLATPEAIEIGDYAQVRVRLHKYQLYQQTILPRLS